MKYVCYLVMLSAFWLGCKSTPDRKSLFPIERANAVKEYFAGNSWTYPLQIDSLDSIRFTDHFYAEHHVFVDSHNIQGKRTILFRQALRYALKNYVASAYGYHFDKPEIVGDSGYIYYALGVYKFKNNRDPNAGCECAQLDSGRIFGYWSWIKFKIQPNDSLQFIRFID